MILTPLLSRVRLRQVLARLLICSVVLFLPACHIPQLRPAQEGPPLPETFNGKADPDSSAQLSIEEFFNDPLLTCLIEQAVVGNQELRILDEDIQIARAEVLTRVGAYLPFVTFNARAGLERSSRFTPLGTAERELEYLPGKHFPDPLPNFLTSFNVVWTPDIWRQLRNSRDAATERYFALIERRNYFTTRLTAEIAENYYRLMALDKRLETLTQTIELQEQGLKIAKAKLEAGRGTELNVQRFQAEVRKNESEKLIVTQDMIEAENRINFLVGRFPQPVERLSSNFFDLKLAALSVGVPAQLLQNRADIRQAERELAAAGLDVLVARARFFPAGTITGRIGYEAFNPRYLFNPEAFIAGIAGELVAPVINKKAIQADYMSANARQLQAVYNYQRVVLNAFTEVVNRMAKVENYSRSIEIKKQQLESLEAAVGSAAKLFEAARAESIEVLFASRDLRDASMTLIDTKREQLSAIVNAYQALGGGAILSGSLPELPQYHPVASVFRHLWPFKHHD